MLNLSRKYFSLRIKKISGFSLLEFVMYIGLTALMLTALITFAWSIISDQNKIEMVTEVNSTGSFVLDKIGYFIPRASQIDVQTIYDSNPGKLVLIFVNDPQIIFDTYTKQIDAGGEVVSIIKLRMKEGNSPAIDLTSDLVSVTNLVFTNLSASGNTTVRIALTVKAVNPSNTRVYAAENSWTMSATIRKRP